MDMEILQRPHTQHKLSLKQEPARYIAASVRKIIPPSWLLRMQFLHATPPHAINASSVMKMHSTTAIERADRSSDTQWHLLCSRTRTALQDA